jgi:hypothetical protein
MDLSVFIQIIGWALGVPSGFITVLRIVYWVWYNFTQAGQHERARDIVLVGGAATFPIMWSGSLFIICVAALLAVYS